MLLKRGYRRIKTYQLYAHRFAGDCFRWTDIYTRKKGILPADFSGRRIAFVKQAVYQDLYRVPNGSSAQKIVLSSIQRTGPVGLFTGLHADFHIVAVDSSPECQVWQQKWTDCQQRKPEYYLNLSRQSTDGYKSQAELACKSEDIDWSQYDVVICTDVSIPTRVIKEYPEVVWAYMIGEPCMSVYEQSHQAPLFGYDLFLNQRYRYYRYFPANASHEIDCPYMIQYYGCFHDLLQKERNDNLREGVMLERYTAQNLNESKVLLDAFGTVRETTGTPKNIIEALLASKYYIQTPSKNIWGNAAIEAIAAGCLVIWNGYGRHGSLFSPLTTVGRFRKPGDLENVVNRIRFFEEHPEQFLKELDRQRSMLNYLCYNRPLSEIFAIVDQC